MLPACIILETHTKKMCLVFSSLKEKWFLKLILCFPPSDGGSNDEDTTKSKLDGRRSWLQKLIDKQTNKQTLWGLVGASDIRVCFQEQDP